MMDRENPVCIVGIGAYTPVGLTAPSSAAAVRAGISAIREHPYFVDKAGEPITVALNTTISPDCDGIERFTALAQPALDEALAPLTNLEIADRPLPVFLGLPEARPGLPEGLVSDLELRTNSSKNPDVPQLQTKIIPKGHAAGLMAIQEALRTIQTNGAEFCLAGGVDSYMEPETLEWLDQEGQLMSAQNRSGFPPGEGAGFCLMTSTDTAHRLKLDILALVVAVGTAQEENCIKTESICIGEGLSKAISQAATALNLPNEKISATYCDMNGERYRSEEFMFTALRTQTAFVRVNDYVAPADCWGDVGAASGLLLASLAVASGLRGYAKGPRALLWVSSESGQRSAVVLNLPTVTWDEPV